MVAAAKNIITICITALVVSGVLFSLMRDTSTLTNSSRMLKGGIVSQEENSAKRNKKNAATTIRKSKSENSALPLSLINQQDEKHKTTHSLDKLDVVDKELTHFIEPLSEDAWAFKNNLSTSMCVRHFYGVAKTLDFQVLAKSGETISPEAEAEVKKFLKKLSEVEEGHMLNSVCYKESTYNEFEKKHSQFLKTNIMMLSFVNVQLLYQDAFLYNKYQQASFQGIANKLVGMKKFGAFKALGEFKGNGKALRK